LKLKIYRDPEQVTKCKSINMQLLIAAQCINISQFKSFTKYY